jgi:hypothetical protein
MSTVTVQTISNGTVSTSTANVINGAKAWVNFNGAGTPTIRASYNVSSITGIATGRYIVNFTNAFSDANYSMQATSTYDNSEAGRLVSSDTRLGTNSTTQVFLATDDGAAYRNSLCVYVAVFR